MDFSKLIIEKKQCYITAAINNPPANALSVEVLSELGHFFDMCLDDQEIRAIIITGAGEKVFSAGADIREFADIRAGKISTSIGQDLVTRMENFSKPIIAAVQGKVFGGGGELILGCHLRVMSDSAALSFPEVTLGITTGWGGTQRLPRLIGKTRALELLLTGEPISAHEALSYGLVNKVVAAEQVLMEAKTLALKLTKMAPIAVRELLRGVTQGLDLPIEQGLAIEREGSKIVFASQDSQEGAEAFYAKRPPKFTGK